MRVWERERGEKKCLILWFGMARRAFSSAIKELNGSFSDTLESRAFVLCTSLVTIWYASYKSRSFFLFLKRKQLMIFHYLFQSVLHIKT